MLDSIFELKLHIMPERVMVVSGAFATHTTKLYNYYVCPATWDVTDLKYIAVNYFKELKYLGEIQAGPFNWNFDEENEVISGLSRTEVHNEIQNDLEKFASLLNGGSHYLFILKPIINNCCLEENLTYKGKGAFTRSHRYFPDLGTLFNTHQNNTTEEISEDIDNLSFNNDGIENDYSGEYFNVVIVPAGRTIEDIKQTNIYKQQLERPFNKAVTYIAFYTNKKIVGYGRIGKIEELTTHREYFIEKFIEIDIPHLERDYFVLNRKYTNLEVLLNAKTTKNI